MIMGKLTIVIAMVLAFGQLQCAAQCAVSTCDFSEPASTQNVPPCHRHHSDSSKQSPASPCLHGVAIASVADSSLAQVPVPVLAVATLAVEPESNSRPQIPGNALAALTSSPPGSGGPSSLILRI